MSDEPERAVIPEAEASSQSPSESPAGLATEAADRPASAGRPRRRRRRGGRGRGTGTGGQAGRSQGAQAAEATAPEAETPPDRGADEARGAEAAPRPARRRRGSRGRGRGRTTPTEPAGAAEALQEEATEAAEPDQPAPTEDVTDTGEKAKARPRRRRSRRKPAAKANERVDASADTRTPAAEGTATEAKPAGGRQAAKASAKPASKPRTRRAAEPKPAGRPRRRAAPAEEEVAGPTRVRRPRTTARRRREPIPVPPRAQDKVMLITERQDRDQIAVLEDRMLVEHYITRVGARSMVGNIYLGRVQNVLPGMEAAFVDVGRGRNAVLYAGEVSYDEEIEGPPPRIEQVIKSGQALMVQVTKDPIGGKGPRLTQQVSLPGRYLVLVPNSQVFGISRRLPESERRRLRMAIRKVRPPEHGVIVRTAAEGASEEDLASDLARLSVEWERIAKKAKRSKAPALLYEEPELTVRVVRDLFTDEEFQEMTTDSPRVYELVKSYLAEVAPDLVEKVRLYDGRLPLYEEFHIVEQIHKALERKVWLPSGGYLVIDRTEAMTVIDVNTGKHVGSKNLEETVVGTNLEAAEEIARQLRLRDIGGMILIDFIDMLLEQNKEKVIETLRQALARDKTRSQVFDISPLGILEVTRKRISAGLLESFSETCPTCGGRGILVTYEL